MTIFTRRKIVLACMLAFAATADAADVPQVNVSVNDKQCEPMSGDAANLLI